MPPRRLGLTLFFLFGAVPLAAQQVTGPLEVHGDFRVVGTMGELVFSGNELSLVSTVDDPPKLRLASPNGSGAVSFNKTRPGSSSQQDELFLIVGGEQEDAVGSLGGQLKLFMRRPYADGDAAMKLMGVISTAYTADGQPVVRWVPTLGPFAEPDPAPSPAPTPTPADSVTLVARQNLRDGSGGWHIAENPNLDTRLILTVSVSTSRTLQISFRRTTTGTAPYLYVYANGTRLAGEQVPDKGTLSVTLGSGLTQIDLVVSAQSGTVEFGPAQIP